MTHRDAESHGKEILRRIANKIRKELLEPDLNVRNLLAQVEQTAHLARVLIDETNPEIRRRVADAGARSS